MSTYAETGWARAIAHGLVLAGLIFAVYFFFLVVPTAHSLGIDGLAYWMVNVPDAYAIPHRAAASFPYSPPAAIAADPFGLIPFWQFLWLWLALLVGSVIWIGGSPGWIVVAFAIPFVSLELYYANIHILLAVAILLGFRHPWTWAFVLLTKFTAGVGLLWFVVRGEWRSLAIALGATAVACAASFLAFPSMWPAWIDYVRVAMRIDTDPTWTNLVRVPLWIRLMLAALLVTWGARTDRRWTVLVSAMMALPVLWVHGFAMLVGLIAEWRLLRATTPTLAARALARMGAAMPLWLYRWLPLMTPADRGVGVSDDAAGGQLR